jgi:hypothetical protein
MDWQGALLVRARTGQTKTYWEQAPQGTARPYVTLLDVTSLRPQTLTGWDLEAARVQIDVWANTYAESRQSWKPYSLPSSPGELATDIYFSVPTSLWDRATWQANGTGQLPCFGKART